MEQHTGAATMQQTLGYQVRVAAAALRGAMEAALRPAGLSPSQYATLDLLAQQPGLTVSDLARGAFVTRQAMHGVLSGLERRGLVARPWADAGRSLPAHLTEAGIRLHAEADARVAQIDDRIRAALSPEDYARTVEVLASIGEAAATTPAPAATREVRPEAR